MKGTLAETAIVVFAVAILVVAFIIGALWLNGWYRDRAIECGFCGTLGSNPACCLPMPVTGS